MDSDGWRWQCSGGEGSQPAEVMDPHQCSSIWSALFPATSRSLQMRPTSNRRCARGRDYAAKAGLAVKPQIRVLLWLGFFTYHRHRAHGAGRGGGEFPVGNSLLASTRFRAEGQRPALRVDTRPACPFVSIAHYTLDANPRSRPCCLPREVKAQFLSAQSVL